jgi:putative NADH-flavin reductase
MNLTLFGATGKTGIHLLQQALDAGHDVTVLVRTPAKLGMTHEHLRVVQGDVQDASRVAEAVGGAEAVLSVLGPTSNVPTLSVSNGMKHIIEAMHIHPVKRIIISAGAGVGDPNDVPGLFDKAIGILLKLTAQNVYEDMLQTVALVRESDLEWTVVRAPMLTDDPKTGAIKAGYVGKGMGPRLSRADLAAFRLAQVDSSQYVRQSPAIGN